MAALRLDFQRSNRPVPWLGWLLLAAAVASAAVALRHQQAVAGEVVHAEARLDRAEREAGRHTRAVRVASPEAQRVQAAEVQHANTVLRELALPWEALFEAVEGAATKDVALLALEPEMRKGRVAITAEAKDFGAMLDYARRLGERDVFASVHLQHHQVQQSDPQRPVRFSLLAVWKGAGQ